MPPSPTTLQALATDLPQADGYLIDLDGTLLSGTLLLPGALPLLARLRGRFVILSNDSEHVPEQLVESLGRAGLSIAAEDIVLSGVVAVESIAARFPGARTLLLGSSALRDLARRLGLRLEAEEPEIVLIARDREFSFDRLAAAAKAVRRGARLILACPDTAHPGPDGEPVPEVGALAAALFACVGNVPHEVIGKPEPTLFKIGCDRLGIAPGRCMMIGDNPLTDGAGAVRAGIGFCQIVGYGHEIVLAN